MTSSHIDFAEVQLSIIEDAAENGHVQIMMIVASYGQIQWTHVHTFWQPQTDISNASSMRANWDVRGPRRFVR